MFFKKNECVGFFSVILINFLLGANAIAHEDHKTTPKDPPPLSGGALFNTCYYCHSLKPGVHLTGPSLAGLWGKEAGKVKGYELYSDALKKSEVTWNEKTLAEWILDTQKVVSGTAMPNTRISDERNIHSLIGFLKIAMAKDGYEKVIKEKLIKEKIANGQLPKYLSEPDKTFIIKAIDSCGQVYSVVLADGSVKKIWRFNLDFKVMPGELGPKENQPIMSPTGSMGDRFEAIFHSFKELSAMVTECKAK